MTTSELSRQQFLAGALAASGLALAEGVKPTSVRAATPQNRVKVSAFIKPITALSYADMARFLAEAGFDGVDVPVRSWGSYIAPEKAAEELPRFAEALDKHGLKVLNITSEITSVRSAHAEALLKTASKLGVKRYRLGFYHYDLKKPVAAQLEALKPQINELAALNKAYGMMGVYQNHDGASFIGNAVWDYYSLIKDLPREQMAFVYDTRHATSEGGFMWETTWNLVQSHLGYVSVKDFSWAGRKLESVPLGTGRVDPRLLQMIGQSYKGDYSLHIEYADQASLDTKKAAFARDISVLRQMVAAGV